MPEAGPASCGALRGPLGEVAPAPESPAPPGPSPEPPALLGALPDPAVGPGLPPDSSLAADVPGTAPQAPLVPEPSEPFDAPAERIGAGASGAPHGPVSSRSLGAPGLPDAPGTLGPPGTPRCPPLAPAGASPGLVVSVGPPGGLGGSGAGARTVFAAEAKRSSRESAATEGPVSPLASSYNCRHQSSS
ncbi:hypothetical protein ACF090_23305 [Streptomyces sp. NPDC014892]|uniref:hypothetical protein n=1 Tax=Streptomyces sp. NPDC014892 TaxID=3364930 RepID=UPI0036FA154B